MMGIGFFIIFNERCNKYYFISAIKELRGADEREEQLGEGKRALVREGNLKKRNLSAI